MIDTWFEHAACRGVNTDVFFPQSRRFTATTWSQARAYCARCVVRRQCLDFALQQQQSEDMWGMFGGMTPSERRKLRRLK